MDDFYKYKEALRKKINAEIRQLGKRLTLDQLRDSSADIDEIATECGAQGEKDAYKKVLEFLS